MQVRLPHARTISNCVPTLRPGTLQLALAVLVAGCSQTAVAHPATQPGPRPEVRAAASTEKGNGAWLTFGADPDHASVNSTETVITSATVKRLHRLWSVNLPDLADERPILVRNLLMPDGRSHDVIYVTTDKGTLIARDATTGAMFWDVTPKSNNVHAYTKASPAADPQDNMIYSYGLDGKVHRFKLTTGREQQGDGWPVLVTKMPQSEKISSALNFVNGYLYVTTASFSGDAPPDQGHVVTINVKTGSTHIFNSLCNDHTHVMALHECPGNGGGIWGRPGVVEDPITGNILFAVSDGYFTINKGGHDWGDSVIVMAPDGSKVLDSYTPGNYATEAFQNRDIGSTAPTLLPTIPFSNTPYLAVQAGKEGLLRLLNRRNMSGQGGPGHVGGELQTLQLPDLCPTLAQPVAWQDPAGGGVWVFVATLCHMDAYRVFTSAKGVTRLKSGWYLGAQATSPIIAGGVLFAASSGSLQALEPHTGHVLWSSAMKSAGGSIDRIHWEAPIVVAGRLYCPDETSHLTAYSL